jgi:hypothetical protein
VGVLQRFERRLGDLVEGTFAKVFKGDVHPSEIAKALQGELDDKRTIVSRGRMLAPNDFVVELSEHDYTRLAPYSNPLTDELAEMVREHAAEEGYSFQGQVRVVLEESQTVDTGVFRIRSGVMAGSAAEGAVAHTGSAAASSRAVAGSAPSGALPGRPRFVLSRGEKADRESPRGRGMEEVYFLRSGTTIIGRGESADIRLSDPKVSREHARVVVEEPSIVILEDMGSTNGTLVNGVPFGRRQLDTGDRVEVGGVTLVYEADLEREEGGSSAGGQGAHSGRGDSADKS